MSNIEINIVTDSSELPVTLAEAKAWLKIDHTEDDTTLSDLIKSSVATVESYIKNPIITKTILYKTSYPKYDEYGEEYVHLPYTPTAVNSVKIYDEKNIANTLTTSSNFGKKVLLGNHYIEPRNNQAYQVEFTAGIAADAANTPEDIKMVIKELVSYFFEGDCCDKTLRQILGTIAGYVNYDQCAFI
jgi:uncharacterized phiE125 gp8 family phage protein|tara:strand:- start:20313 stop:20873 length:561 start_codon:yes stop_codon:yes gene_type:complete